MKTELESVSTWRAVGIIDNRFSDRYSEEDDEYYTVRVLKVLEQHEGSGSYRINVITEEF